MRLACHARMSSPARNDRVAVAQVLCRLADPLEYQDEPRLAQRVAQELNRFLALEGLEVTYAGGRPHIVELSAAMTAPGATAPVHLQCWTFAQVRTSTVLTAYAVRKGSPRTRNGVGAAERI
jgi:hypothetical protein